MNKKKYKKPELKIHGDAKKITAGSSPPYQVEPGSFADSEA